MSMRLRRHRLLLGPSHFECPTLSSRLPPKVRLTLESSTTDQVMMGPLALRAVDALADAYACCGDEHRDFGCFHIGRSVTTDLGGV